MDVDHARATLAEGVERRRTGSTTANKDSSRSHCLVCVRVRTECAAQVRTTPSATSLLSAHSSSHLHTLAGRGKEHGGVDSMLQSVACWDRKVAPSLYLCASNSVHG